MADEQEVEIPETQEAPKPKRKRRTKKEAAPEAAEPKTKRAPKRDEDDDDDSFQLQAGESFVKQEGAKVTLFGKHVTLNGLSKDDIKKWSITKVEGAIGQPCKETMVLTFKNAKAAAEFFDYALNEDENEDIITTAPAVKWFGDGLGF